MAIIREHFAGEMDFLSHRLLEMASVASSMVESAMQALTGQDEELARAVIARDDEVDALDRQIEAECLRLIALQQPVAHDLRFIGMSFKVITDLERIGDHAVDIAQIAITLAGAPHAKPLVDLPKMAVCVRNMLYMATAAFVNRDLKLVHQVLDADDEVDTLFRQIEVDLYKLVAKDPTLIERASRLMFVAHYLERIADHTVNIAERIHTIETGEAPSAGKPCHKA